MSPDHDPNLQPSVPEAASGEPVAEDSNHGTSAEADSRKPSALTTSGTSTGAATAVARAQENSAVSPAKDAAVEETASADATAPAKQDAARSATASASTAEISEKNEVSTEAAPSAEIAQPSVTGTEMKGPDAAEAAESSETMDQLLDQFAVPEPVAAEGEIFDGRVLAVTDAGVIVDVGGKFEGLVPAQEFVDSGSPIHFGKGQTIEVERLHEQKNGYVLLSHVRAHRRRVWERTEKSYREHATITGKVTERIKGGLVVDIGVRAFLPASQNRIAPGARSGYLEGSRYRRARPEIES